MRVTDNWQKASAMNPLRKQARHDGLVVDYNEDVTEEQVRRIDDLVQEE